MKSILFVASEGLPFIKSGGLADVIGSLPHSLKQKNMDVRVVLPLYLKIALNHRESFKKVKTFPVLTGQINTVATLYEKDVQGVIYYFIEHQGYFEREGLYGYYDDGARFAFFQKAVLEMLRELQFYPEIIHSHDWHTGMIPAMCKIHYANDKKYQKIKHVYTIHNLAYQGNFPVSVLTDCLGISDSFYHDGSMRFYQGVSFMKAGILFADKISTVSPTYSHEILTKEYGENMDEVLSYRKDDLWGITNGIDTKLWDPSKDKLLSKKYSLKSYASGKKANKKALQEELGLRVTPDTMLVGMVSRLTNQKGIHLILEKLADIMGLDLQFIVLGSGEGHIEDAFKHMEYKYKRRAVFYCGYNEELAHRIYAGCDVFLMPSLFEPCGISQLIAMRYGTLPLVRETGGLKDTVTPFNQYDNTGTGFSFASKSSDDLYYTLRYACDTYYLNSIGFNAMIENAMKEDVSFEKSCKLYLEMYNMVLSKK